MFLDQSVRSDRTLFLVTTRDRHLKGLFPSEARCLSGLRHPREPPLVEGRAQAKVTFGLAPGYGIHTVRDAHTWFLRMMGEQ